MPSKMSSFFGSTLRPNATVKASEAPEAVQSTLGKNKAAKSTVIDPSGAPKIVEQKKIAHDGIVMSFGDKKLLLGKVVGSGSFGTVRMVGEMDGSAVKLYAVKAIRDSSAVSETSLYESAQGKRFRHEMARQEIDILLKAGSPLVPKYFLADENNTTAFIVMPLMTGTLEELASSLPKQASAERTALANHALPLFGALADLHRRGIAHMDIKPANIFVGQDLSLVLGDFGIATHNAKGWGARGTPIFMAPEVFSQYEGLQRNTVIGLTGGSEVPYAASSYATRPTDLYSLGLTLLTILTGRNPVNYWDYNAKSIAYDAGMRAIHNMHMELGKAEPQLSAWRSGKALPSSMTNPLNLKPAHRQLLTFFKQLAGVDAKQPGVAAALTAVSFNPKTRLETLGYKEALPLQAIDPAVQLLADNMPSAVNKALKDCPLLGRSAINAVNSGRKSLFTGTTPRFVAPIPALKPATLSPVEENLTPETNKRARLTFGSVISLGALFKTAATEQSHAGASASGYSLRRLFKMGETEEMTGSEVEETLANEVVML